MRQSVPAYKVLEHKKMIMIFHQIFKKKMHQIFSVRLGFWCYFVRLYQKMGQEIAISSQENYLLMISQWYQKWQNLDIKKPQIPATFRNISKHVFQNPVNFNSPLFYRLNYARITRHIIYLKSAQVKDFLNILQRKFTCRKNPPFEANLASV